MGWPDLIVTESYESNTIEPDSHGWVNLGQNDVCALFGLLEMHTATGNSSILDSARNLGQQLLQRYSVDGWITSHGRNGDANIDTALPLALLHLETAGNNGEELPAFYANNTYFDPKIVIRKRRNQ